MLNVLENCLPFFKDLTNEEKNKLSAASHSVICPPGQNLRSRKDDCLGFVIVKKGRIRVYMTSNEGREITLYRLIDGDMCLFSASCAMSNIQFDVMLKSEEESEVVIISPGVYKELMDSSLPVAKYTTELLSSRLSDIMWLMDQVLNKRLDSRLAALLVEESNLRESNIISLTQEQLANHLGTAREVVTRMLKNFQSEGLVQLKRGTVELINIKALQHLSLQ